MDWVIKILSLIDNVYPTTIKAKMTISIDDPAIKKVMNLRNIEGTQKTKLDMGGKGRKEVSDKGSKGVVDVANGDIVGGKWEISAGTKYKGGDGEEPGLKLVSGDNEWSMVGVPFKCNDSQDSWEEFILDNKI